MCRLFLETFLFFSGIFSMLASNSITREPHLIFMMDHEKVVF
jgi:hypothetical protein